MRLNVSVDHCRRVTRADRLRFLLKFLRIAPRRKALWKPIWYALADMSSHKRYAKARNLEHKLRRHGRF
jgi:hypothetical protein